MLPLPDLAPKRRYDEDPIPAKLSAFTPSSYVTDHMSSDQEQFYYLFKNESILDPT